MMETDNPLKILVRENIGEVAAWLLGQEVKSVHATNVELQAPSVFSDTVFEVDIANQGRCLLHIEFQGRSSRPEMWERQLVYISRLADQYKPLYLESVVFYVEKGAGRHDNGHYQVLRPDGSPAIAWHYRVMRLWQMDAEEILQQGKAGLIPLMALMHIEHPDETIPQMVAQIRREEGEERQKILINSLLALMSDEECVKMVEKLLESDELVWDTPYLRRIREKARIEGLEQGIAEGIEKGMEKGIAEGIEKGMEKGMEKGLEKGMEKGLEKGITEGMEKGLEKGITEGLEKGKAEGLRQGLLEAIILGLRLKWGAGGINLLPEVHAITDLNLLHAILDSIEIARNPEEVHLLILNHTTKKI